MAMLEKNRTALQSDTDSDRMFVRFVILMNTVKKLESEVQRVDQIRQHAEQNDLMNTAAQLRLTQPTADAEDSRSRKQYTKIYKIHTCPEPNALAMILAIPVVEVPLSRPPDLLCVTKCGVCRVWVVCGVGGVWGV